MPVSATPTVTPPPRVMAQAGRTLMSAPIRVPVSGSRFSRYHDREHPGPAPEKPRHWAPPHRHPAPPWRMHHGVYRNHTGTTAHSEATRQASDAPGACRTNNPGRIVRSKTSEVPSRRESTDTEASTCKATRSVNSQQFVRRPQDGPGSWIQTELRARARLPKPESVPREQTGPAPGEAKRRRSAASAAREVNPALSARPRIGRHRRAMLECSNREAIREDDKVPSEPENAATGFRRSCAGNPSGPESGSQNLTGLHFSRFCIPHLGEQRITLRGASAGVGAGAVVVSMIIAVALIGRLGSGQLAVHGRLGLGEMALADGGAIL